MNSETENSKTANGNGPAKTANPLDVLLHEHTLQEILCDTLERIADGLPDNVDRSLVTAVLPMLMQDLAIHMCDEERGLFPLLDKRTKAKDNFAKIWKTLSQEHAADWGYAEELIEQLEGLASGKRPDNPDMLGYMLRGFFETQRRHLAWENTVLLPLAHSRLNADDLRELSKVMVENRRENSGCVTKRLVGLFAISPASDEG